MERVPARGGGGSIAPEIEGRRRKDAAALVLAVILGLLLDVRSTGELERAWRAFELVARWAARGAERGASPRHTTVYRPASRR